MSLKIEAMEMNIEINNRQLKATRGETILDVLTRNGIKVPTLCHMKDYFPSGLQDVCGGT